MVVESLPVGECAERLPFLLGREKGQRLKGPRPEPGPGHFTTSTCRKLHCRPHIGMPTTIASELALVGQSGVPFEFSRVADFSIVTRVATAHASVQQVGCLRFVFFKSPKISFTLIPFPVTMTEYSEKKQLRPIGGACL